MGKRTILEKPKRLDKLTKTDHEGLVFDLINAFAVVNNPTDSALLMHDLLTKSEINNLSKRLRIAKLILSGKTHDEITKEYTAVSVLSPASGHGLWKEVGDCST